MLFIDTTIYNYTINNNSLIKLFFIMTNKLKLTATKWIDTPIKLE